MLDVEGLTKRFGAVTALEDVTFSIAEGEVVGLLGENGAGKTTTLRLLAGSLFPSAGKIFIGGRDLFREPLLAKRKVGYLPEQLPLDAGMRVRPYLDYVARLRGLSARERADGVGHVLAVCGLEGVAERGIGALSRGLRTRVGLAQALVHNPELVLLDEPTAGLDPQQVRNMRELILSLSGHHTILFSSHNLHEVSECCKRVLVLKEGRVAAEDALASLEGRDGDSRVLRVRMSKPPDDVCGVLAGLAEVTHAEPAEGFVLVTVLANEGVRERLAAEVVARGWGLCEMTEVSESLEDVFQRHVGVEA
jgi:ABC-2 type transport system ATP-binding protein